MGLIEQARRMDLSIMFAICFFASKMRYRDYLWQDGLTLY